MTMPVSDRSGVPTAAGGLGAAWSVIVGPLQSTAALAPVRRGAEELTHERNA